MSTTAPPGDSHVSVNAPDAAGECKTWEKTPQETTGLLRGGEDGTMAETKPLTSSQQVQPQLSGSERRSIFIAVFSVLLSIPALIGAWCWPLVVASILSISVSGTSIHFAHAFTSMITFTIMTNMAQYVGLKCQSRVGTHLQRWGPFYLAALAVPLVMTDLVWHLIADNALIKDPPKSYNPECTGPAIACLTAFGWFISIITTWSGYICLFISVFWVIDFHKKIRAKYNAVRNQRVTATTSS